MPKLTQPVALTVSLVFTGAALAGTWPELFSVWLQPSVWLLTATLIWWMRAGFSWQVIVLLVVGWVGALGLGTRVGSLALARRFALCSGTLAAFVSPAKEHAGRVLYPDVNCFPVRSIEGISTASGQVAVVVRPDYPTRDIWVHTSGVTGARFGNRCLEKLNQEWYRAHVCPSEEP